MDDLYESLEHDYRLAGFQAATETIEDDFIRVTLSDDMFVPMADHHSADGRDSYFLFYDRAAIWDVPGQAEFVTLHIARDTEQRTFAFEVERAPVVPLAQNWLIRQGCPPEATLATRNHGPRPADALTSRLEDQLRTNPDGRYEVLDDFTDNPCTFDFGVETRTLVYDHHPDSASAPYRLFLEETDKYFQTYTVREGTFATAEAADDWAMTRATPLPLAPTPDASSTHRAQAARARSTAKPPAPLAVPPSAVGTPRTPPPAAARTRGGAR
ncbi:hypothetical protein ABII15_36070 [Streptomyces sp. HUAS MG91]|uniref:CYTH domain-containing protein n=1 Tax=Streptomyces tabacisoli TaxID=3156398 RepID=A0AAU8J3F2_9ACTN